MNRSGDFMHDFSPKNGDFSVFYGGQKMGTNVHLVLTPFF